MNAANRAVPELAVDEAGWGPTMAACMASAGMNGLDRFLWRA